MRKQLIVKLLLATSAMLLIIICLQINQNEAKKIKIKLKDLKKLKKYAHYLAYQRKKFYAIPFPVPLPVFVKRQHIYTQVPIVHRYVEQPSHEGSGYSSSDTHEQNESYQQATHEDLHHYMPEGTDNQHQQHYNEHSMMSASSPHKSSPPSQFANYQNNEDSYRRNKDGLQTGASKYINQISNFLSQVYPGFEDNKDVLTKLWNGQAKIILPSQFRFGNNKQQNQFDHQEHQNQANEHEMREHNHHKNNHRNINHHSSRHRDQETLSSNPVQSVHHHQKHHSDRYRDEQTRDKPNHQSNNEFQTMNQLYLKSLAQQLDQNQHQHALMMTGGDLGASAAMLRYRAMNPFGVSHAPATRLLPAEALFAAAAAAASEARPPRSTSLIAAGSNVMPFGSLLSPNQLLETAIIARHNKLQQQQHRPQPTSLISSESQQISDNQAHQPILIGPVTDNSNIVGDQDSYNDRLMRALSRARQVEVDQRMSAILELRNAAALQREREILNRLAEKSAIQNPKTSAIGLMPLALAIPGNLPATIYR